MPSMNRTLPVLVAAGAVAALAAAAIWTGAHRDRRPTPGDGTPAPRISPGVAAAIALNDLETVEGGITLVHPRHVAEFRSAGVAFAPKRGPRWTWTLVAAGADGALRPAPAVPPALTGRDVEYARDGFVERYRCLAASVEQLFVLERAPQPAGRDFVVEGAIACTGEFEAAPAGWTWRTAGGVVSFGRLKVVDATGRELPSTMAVEPAGVRLVVDGGALAGAAYPVTLDPEIGTNDFRISAMGPDGDVTFDARHGDVAYNATNGEYLVVWEGDDDVPGVGDGQFEIHGQRVSASTGLEVGTNDFRISDMGVDGDPDADAVAPAVAWSATLNEYLVVWAGDDGGATTANGESEIYGQRLAGATGAEVGANDFRISDMGPDGDARFDAGEPDVAWNPAAGEYLVVWEGDDGTGLLVDDEREIYGQRIAGATGLAVGTNDFRISDMGADGDSLSDATAPAAVYAATPGHYLVVWSGDNGTPLADGEFEIYGQRLAGPTGAELGTNDFRISDMGPDGDAAWDAVEPAVAWASGENRYLVAWSGDDNAPGLVEGEREIFGQLIDGVTGAAVGPNDPRYSQMGPDGDPIYDARSPAVAYDAQTSEFLVAWDGDDKGGGLTAGEFEVFGQLVDATSGLETGSDDFPLSEMGIPGNVNVGGFAPALAVRTSGTFEYFVTWHADQDTLGLVDDEFEVYAQRIDGNRGRETGPNDVRLSDMGPDGDIDYDARFPAVAFDPFDARYLVVWEADDTTGTLVDGETEIFGRLLDAATGDPVGPTQFRISHMGPDGDAAYDAQDAAVAFDPVRREWLVVWAGETNTGGLVNGEFEIWGQRLDALGREIGADDFRISDMGPDGDPLYDAAHPRVAHDAANDQYLVVWDGDDAGGATVEGELEIFGQRLDGSGAAVGANDFRISDMGPDGNAAFDALDPAVVHNPVRGEFLVAWWADDTVDGESEIFVQRLDAAGLEVGPNDARISHMGPDLDPRFDAGKPAIAFDPTRDAYLVAWEGDDSTAVLAEGEQEIFAQRLSGAAAEIGADDFRVSDMGPDGDPLYDAAASSVAYVPSEDAFLVAWDADDTLPIMDGETEIFGQRLDAATGLEAGENDFRLSDMGPDLDGVFDASHPSVAVAAPHHRALVVWQGDDDTGALGAHEFEILGQQYTGTGLLDVASPAPRGLALALAGTNPVRGPARVRLALDSPGDVALDLHDVAGRRVAHRLVRFVAAGSVELELDTRGCAPGVYLARATGGGRTAVRKITITR